MPLLFSCFNIDINSKFIDIALFISQWNINDTKLHKNKKMQNMFIIMEVLYHSKTQIMWKIAFHGFSGNLIEQEEFM